MSERDIAPILFMLRLDNFRVALGLAQPSISKHLQVLREVGLVHSRRDGRQVWYRTNANAIRPLYEWVGTFERFWSQQLRRIKGPNQVSAQRDRRALRFRSLRNSIRAPLR